MICLSGNTNINNCISSDFVSYEHVARKLTRHTTRRCRGRKDDSTDRETKACRCRADNSSTINMQNYTFPLALLLLIYIKLKMLNISKHA